MYIRIIVIIIAVNAIKAEHESPNLHSNLHEDGRHIESEENYAEPYQIPKTRHALSAEKSSTDTSLGSSDDYESIEYVDADTENTRRYSSNQEKPQGDEEDRNASLDEKTADKSLHGNKPSKEANKRINEHNIDPNKRKLIANHLILDTKGRSAAEDVNEDNFKMAAPDFRNLNDPRPQVTNHRPCYKSGNVCNPAPNPAMNGHMQLQFPLAPQPGLFHGPLYTVHHPFLFPTSPDLNPSIIRSPPAEERENIPFVNSNSYPYQTPSTKMDETPQERDSKLDILKKLIDATNSALTTNKPNPHLEPNNMYPINFNPGAGRFRRYIKLNVNSLRTT